MLLALISVGLNALAQLTIKALALQDLRSALDILKFWQVYATGFLYLTSVVTWFFAMRTIPLSVGYPMQAMGYVLVSALGVLMFRENINSGQVLGLVIIVLGVATLAIATPK